MTIPHCPNSRCSHFHHPPRGEKWYRKKGFQQSKRRGKVQRYQCKGCHRQFDLNAFMMDFYIHRTLSYRSLFNKLKSGAGIRSMARDYRCTTKVIQNRIRRMARKMMALSMEAILEMQLGENLSADGLESFVLSQYFPSNINVLAGSRSQFLYYSNMFYFRRKGRTTKEQKKRMEELYRIAHFQKHAPTRAFRDLLDFLEELIGRSDLDRLILDTDENPLYRSTLKKHSSLRSRVIHRRTNSREERNYQNKLFSCNYIDRQIRKDLAEHKRETVQFCRNSNNSMERFVLYSFWHNFMKPFRENKRRKGYRVTHGEKAGIPRERIEGMVERAFDGRRIFPEQMSDLFTPFQRDLWDRKLPNPLKVAAV